MIVTVTANAAIDRTLHIPKLVAGRHHKVQGEHAQAGGKGVNVARVLHALGIPVRAIVVVGGATGEWIVRDLEASGIRVEAVEAPGESRTCLEIVEAETGTASQMHGLGVQADHGVAERLRERVRDLCTSLDVRWLAVCGSQARGLPEECSGELLREARAAGARTAIDTSGAALAYAAETEPDLLRVNREEAIAAFGMGVAEDPAHHLPLARVGVGAISDGAEPIAAWSRSGSAWKLMPPRVELRNPVGCGDAMLAGMLKCLWAGESAEDALRFGAALGAADAEVNRAGQTSPERGRALASQVKLLALS